jgi:HK97 family phage major capsid protein
MSGVPTNRTNISLPAEVSREIIQKTQESSTVMRLARQIALPGRGLTIPVITGDPVANWVTETGTKPVSNPNLSQKVMQAHKLAVIVPFSNEFRRDAAALYDALIARLPGVLARKFDNTVFFGPTGGSLANFDDFSNVDAASLQSSVYGGLVTADGLIAEEGGIMNGVVLAPQGKSVLLGALDTTNRPIFIDSVAQGGVPTVLGASTYVTGAAYKAGSSAVGSTAAVPDIIGFAGDWTKAMWGTVEGVVIDYSSDATLTYSSGSDTETINLFQQNMFAVRAEIEVGFVAQDDYFVALTRTHSA